MAPASARLWPLLARQGRSPPPPAAFLLLLSIFFLFNIQPDVCSPLASNLVRKNAGRGRGRRARFGSGLGCGRIAARLRGGAKQGKEDPDVLALNKIQPDPEPPRDQVMIYGSYSRTCTQANNNP